MAHEHRRQIENHAGKRHRQNPQEKRNTSSRSRSRPGTRVMSVLLGELVAILFQNDAAGLAALVEVGRPLVGDVARLGFEVVAFSASVICSSDMPPCTSRSRSRTSSVMTFSQFWREYFCQRRHHPLEVGRQGLPTCGR